MTESKHLRERVALLSVLGFGFAPQAPADVSVVVSVCDETHFLAAVNSPYCAGCVTDLGPNVTFSCSGVITLSGPVTIRRTQTIDGGGVVGFDNPGSSFSSGAFKTTTGAFGPITLTLANLTIQHVHGGAVGNSQELHVSNVKFILNDGSFPPYNLPGGAIYNSGTLTVDDSYFSLNSGPSGGAIYNTGLLTVRSSTFQFNNANADLSKNQLQAGGAIFNDGGSMIIVNSTFVDNGLTSGVGGNIYSRGDGVSEIRNCTLSNGRAAPGKAGNLYVVPNSQSGALFVVNTIMANPEGGAGNCQGIFIDGGGNLQWPVSSEPCVGALADPKLGPPSKNFGPTLTMALGPGSAAIDRGYDLLCTSQDQRHILRPQGAHCDIGAYEAIPNTTGAVALLVSSIEQKFWSSLPKTGQNRLTEQVLAPLSSSLDPTLWQADGNRLNPQRGEQVFDLHQTVVKNLSELIVDQTQLDYIANLVFTDRTIATVAMGDGGCSVTGAPVSANSKCAQAAAELANGDTSSAAGKYGEAIAHYQSAWSDVAQPSHQ